MIGTKLIVIAGAVALVLVGLWGYGHYQYKKGASDLQDKITIQNAALTQAMQAEKDQADANYRGAVLARQAMETTVSDQSKRISGLLGKLAAKRKNTSAAAGPDAAGGDDWIGIFSQCYSAYERVGKDAARMADKIGGLQGYIKSVQPKKSD